MKPLVLEVTLDHGTLFALIRHHIEGLRECKDLRDKRAKLHLNQLALLFQNVSRLAENGELK